MATQYTAQGFTNPTVAPTIFPNYNRFLPRLPRRIPIPIPNAPPPIAPVNSLPVAAPLPTPALPQAPLPVTLPAAVTPSVTPTGPTFQDILNQLKQPTTINTNQPLQGSAYTERALGELAPGTGLRPEIQNVLDLINKNTAEARMKGISEAQALAGKRGIAGSSTEQFGTQQAAFQAEKAGQDATASILLENAKREQALQDARARILADRGTLEGQLGAQVGTDQAKLITEKLLKGVDLTSDEIASVRNTDFANKQLGIQYLLGQQGLDVQRQNIGVSQQIAADQARNNLYSAGISALAPSLLGGLFGGGGGGAGGGGLLSGLGGLFGGGGGGGALTGVGTGQVVPGIGAVGTGAGAGGIGLAPALGLGALAFAGYQALPDNGLISKSTIAPLANPLQTAKQAGHAISSAVKSVGKSVSKVFRF